MVTIIGIRTAFRWNCAICSDGLCRPATVEFLCHGSGRCLEQPHPQCQSHQQGILPPLDRSDRSGDGCVRGFSHQLCYSRGPYDLVSIYAGLADSPVLPLFAAIAFVTSFGIGVWSTALNVKYRDFRYVVPFIVQLGLYVSPVGFSSSIVPEQWRLVYSLNPMVGVIDGFRWCCLGARASCICPVFGSAWQSRASSFGLASGSSEKWKRALPI